MEKEPSIKTLADYVQPLSNLNSNFSRTVLFAIKPSPIRLWSFEYAHSQVELLFTLARSPRLYIYNAKIVVHFAL